MYNLCGIGYFPFKYAIDIVIITVRDDHVKSEGVIAKVINLSQ